LPEFIQTTNFLIDRLCFSSMHYSCSSLLEMFFTILLTIHLTILHAILLLCPLAIVFVILIAILLACLLINDSRT
jgi:hypothetical protein